MTGPPAHTTESSKVASPKAARPVLELPHGLPTSVYQLSLPCPPANHESERAHRKSSQSGGSRLYYFQLPAVSQGRSHRPHGSFSSVSSGVGSRGSSARTGGHGGHQGLLTPATASHQSVPSGIAGALLPTSGHGSFHSPFSSSSSSSNTLSAQHVSQHWDRSLEKLSLVVRG